MAVCARLRFKRIRQTAARVQMLSAGNPYRFAARYLVSHRTRIVCERVVRTDVAELVRLGAAVGGPAGGERTQAMTEDGGGVSSGGVQRVTEVTERGEDATSTVLGRRRGRRQAMDELRVTTAQRQPVAAAREEHRRQVAVRSTQRLAVACVPQFPQPQPLVYNNNNIL